jgi:hypothetical protein
MSIPLAAKKCPYCHHWQRWFSFANPPIIGLLIFVPILGLYAFMMEIAFKPFRQWEQFPKHSNQVRIVESKMDFGEDQCGPAVIVVGTVENRSPVHWKDVRFQVDFLNPKGEFFDTGQQEIHTWRLPAGEAIYFKVSFRRQFPEKDYANHKVRVVSAVDSRQWP